MSQSASNFDSSYFRTALGRFATGVTVVTTESDNGEPVGLTVSSFNSVSLQPPLILWSLSHAASSLAVFEQCERYVVNVLAADQLELAVRFARKGATDRFKGLPERRAPSGTLMLDGCVAWFECRNKSRYPEGDHVIMVGQVLHCGHGPASPLVFHAGGFDLTPASGALSAAAP